MRIALFSLVFLSFISVLTAQRTHTFSLVLGTDYLYRKLSVNPDLYVESPKVHFRLGGDYTKTLTSSCALRTGIRLTSFRYDSGVQPVITQATIPVEFGGQGLEEDPVWGATMRFRDRDYFAEVPLIVRYRKQPEAKFYLEAGGAANAYLITFSRFDAKTSSREWTRQGAGSPSRILMSAQIGAGWAWVLRSERKVFLRPVLRYYFADNDRFRMLSGGLETGIAW